MSAKFPRGGGAGPFLARSLILKIFSIHIWRWIGVNRTEQSLSSRKATNSRVALLRNTRWLVAIKPLITSHIFIKPYTISKLDHTVKIVVLLTLERLVQTIRTLIRYQNDDMTLLIIELYFWNVAPAINLACHSHGLYNAGNDSYKQYCLFSNPVICLYIIVLLKHALYVRNKYCLN